MKNLKRIFDLRKKDRVTLYFRLSLFPLLGIVGLLLWHTSAQMQVRSLAKRASLAPMAAQRAVFTTPETASNRIVIFPDANAPGTQNLVPGLPADAVPHGVSHFGSDRALVSDFDNGRVFVVQPSTAALISTIVTPAYNGMGTIAVAPSLTAALASAEDTLLVVIHAPFGPGSVMTTVALPDEIRSYQTQGIVFNNAGRAFVYHLAGISVLDPPYSSIAFTIPVVENERGGAIAITPNDNTLLVTDLLLGGVKIFNAPFSAASTPEILMPPQHQTTFITLDGIMVAPDGMHAIVASGMLRTVFSVAAPFSSTSVVEELQLPPHPKPGGLEAGYEDVGISSDSQIAILAGGGFEGDPDPAIIIRAPFTAAGAVISLLPITGVANSSRGVGSVRFAPPGLVPIRTLSDFDGDGKADLAVFRPMPDPANNQWYIRRSSDNSTYRSEWGLQTDRLASADYDGDGMADLAIWRDEPLDPDRANFYILQSSDNAIRIEQFGRTGDVHSVVGDWDGDERADLAVYRNGAGGGQSQFFYRPSTQPATNFTTISWGIAGDKAVRGDFDGDGSLDAAVFRPSDATWYIRQSSNAQVRYDNWGTATDKFVCGDYDGDGNTDLAVFRDGVWYIKQSLNNQPSYVTFGLSTDVLVPADYDGDGKADVAVYRNGAWYINQSTAGFAVFNFGLSTDIPVPGSEN